MVAREFQQNDHDLLIRLATQMEANNEITRVLVADVGKLAIKLDQMRDSHAQYANDIKDLKREANEVRRTQSEFDIRVATLEHQVDAIREDSAKSAAVTAAVRESDARRHDRVESRTKRIAFATGFVSFIITMGPYLLKPIKVILGIP